MRATEPHSGPPRTPRKFGAPPSPGPVPAGPPAPGPLACLALRTVRRRPPGVANPALPAPAWAGLGLRAPPRRAGPATRWGPPRSRPHPPVAAPPKSSRTYQDFPILKQYVVIVENSKYRTTGRDHVFPLLPTPSGQRLLVMLLCLSIYIFYLFCCAVFCISFLL